MEACMATDSDLDIAADAGKPRPPRRPPPFGFFRPRFSHVDKSLSSVELPILDASQQSTTSYYHLPLDPQQAGGQNSDADAYLGHMGDRGNVGRSSSVRTKTSIFKSDDHRLKHSILRGSKPKKIGEIVFHFVISLIAVIFLVMPILAYRLDGTEVDDTKEDGGYGGRVLNLIQYGPTIFPIIFAAITGHFLRAIALRLAERGATLETLEQLTRSITISSTITTPYLLNSYNFLTGVLLCLWAVSPLGGQASLRILRTNYVEFQEVLNVTYLDPFNQSSFVEIGADVGLSLTETNNIYISSLLSSAGVKAGPVDSWNNIKIPLLESFETNTTATKNGQGWYDVPMTNVTYSSLLGNPIRNLTTNSTAIIQSGYATINCPFLELIDVDKCDSGRTTDCFNTTDPIEPEWTFPAHPTVNDEAANVEYIVTGFNTTQTLINNTFYDRTTPMDLIVQSRGKGGNSVGHCVLSQTFVEAQVKCLSSSCRVSQMRRLDASPKRPPLFVDAPEFILHNFFIWFARVAPPGHAAYSNPSQLYILYPENPLSVQNGWYDIATAGKEEFGLRLTQLMNTFLSSTYGGGLYLGSIPIGPDGIKLFGNRTVGYKTVLGTGTTLKHIYMVRRPWAGITLLASLLLLSMGMAAAVVGFCTLAPDVLTSLSALANESPWFDTIKEGTTLDGDDKAEALKKRLVRLGDVKRFDDVGYIALGTIDTEVSSVGRLSTDRVYR
ncbi:hypothetical protein Dda_5728 [Drechslerella dactyloides]|uniref:Uncharacterized protein n=1 Tax=Drechslerella dactyloides TaxID=74499 RepID=A0AAD6J115_DREDA|nr:hypothetical protein Dda_5728 [Drechslerella dactyloides]